MNPRINLIIFISSFVLAVFGFVYLNYKISQYETRLGSTITTIQANDLISDSRAVINTNLSNLNTDKLESGSTASTLTIGTLTNSALSSGLATVGYLVSTSTATSTFAGGISSKIGGLFSWIEAGISQFGYFTATSTATSTSLGGFSASLGTRSSFLEAGKGQFGSLFATSTSATTTLQGTIVGASGGNFGIGSSTPTAYVSITNPNASATTTIDIGKKSCLQFYSPSGSIFRLYATSSGFALFEAGACQ